MRTNNSYQVKLHDFLKYDIPVVCPKCSSLAIVKTYNFTYADSKEDEIKVVCTKCGFNKRYNDKPKMILGATRNKVIRGRMFVVGGRVDPFFHLPLWFVTRFGGRTLWAYNNEHLEFLKIHVQAKLRERTGQNYVNRSMGSRMPRWMNSKKNREPLLIALTALQYKK